MAHPLSVPLKTSYLSEQTVIEGTVTSKEDLTINAHIIGQVVGESSVTLETQASIEGSVYSQKLMVRGAVRGAVRASELLEILPESQILGDIIAPQGGLIIAEGSQIEGTCSMPSKSS